MPSEKNPLKRPRGLLASRKSQNARRDAGSGTKKPRLDDTQDDITPETLKAEDWSDLKELYENASDAFYGKDPTSALPLVRGTLHECARLVTVYEDPTLLYSPLATSAPTANTEPASAFYTIYASAWYIMFTLMREHPSARLEDEPKQLVAYLLSALESCRKGQAALDVRIQEKAWDLELVWGRILVSSAQAKLAFDKRNDGETMNTKPSSSAVSHFARLAGSDPLLILAEGIKRIARALNLHETLKAPATNQNEQNDTNSTTDRFARLLIDSGDSIRSTVENVHDTTDCDPDLTEGHLSTAQILFSRVTTMSGVSEELAVQGQFGSGRTQVTAGVISGERFLSANVGVEEDEDRWEKEKEQLGEVLANAVGSFESVRRIISQPDKNWPVKEEDIKPWLQEALVTMAMLLPKGSAQDAMYKKYQAEGGILDDEEDSDEGEVNNDSQSDNASQDVDDDEWWP